MPKHSLGASLLAGPADAGADGTAAVRVAASTPLLQTTAGARHPLSPWRLIVSSHRTSFTVADEQYVEGFHGTTKASAATIITSGFRPSHGGMLGAGVYWSDDVAKTRPYVRDSSGTVLKLQIRNGRTKTIDRRGHPSQTSWHAEGYDSAWVPPSTRPAPGWVKSGLSENCTFDPSRITVVAVSNDYGTTFSETPQQFAERIRAERRARASVLLAIAAAFVCGSGWARNSECHDHAAVVAIVAAGILSMPCTICVAQFASTIVDGTAAGILSGMQTMQCVPCLAQCASALIHGMTNSSCPWLVILDILIGVVVPGALLLSEAVFVVSFSPLTGFSDDDVDGCSLHCLGARVARAATTSAICIPAFVALEVVIPITGLAFLGVVVRSVKWCADGASSFEWWDLLAILGILTAGTCGGMAFVIVRLLLVELEEHGTQIA